MTQPNPPLLYGNFDATVWAQEFAAIAKTKYGADLDQEWLITWFSNAIMTGYDRRSPLSKFWRSFEYARWSIVNGYMPEWSWRDWRFEWQPSEALLN